MDQHRMASGFTRAAWGVVFLFDLSIGTGGRSVDVLPDVIGYLLFLAAARRVRPHASGAVAISAVLVPFGLAQVAIDLSASGSRLLFTGIGTLATVLEIALVWLLLGAAAYGALAVGDPGLAVRARTRRVLYALSFPVAWVVVTVLGLAGPQRRDIAGIAIVAIIAIVVITFVLTVLVITALRATSRVLRTRPPADPPPAMPGSRLSVTRALVVLAVAVVVLLGVGLLAVDGGAPPVETSGGVEYRPVVTSWTLSSTVPMRTYDDPDASFVCSDRVPCETARLEALSGARCLWRGTVHLSSVGYVFLVRPNLDLAIRARVWSGYLRDDSVAEPIWFTDRVGEAWWWRAAGLRVKAVVPVPCDVFGIEVAVEHSDGPQGERDRPFGEAEVLLREIPAEAQPFF